MTKKLPVVVSEEEFTKLIKSTKKTHHKVAFLLGYGAGLRVSEVVNLKREHIKVQDKTIFVKQGKGGKDRIVPLPKGFKEKHLQYIPIKCGVRALQRAFRRSCEAGGLLKVKPDLHFHCVDDKTKILTKNGWKDYTKLKKGEKIFSYNINKEIIEDDIIKEINKFDFNGEMINLKNTYLDCFFTKEHKDLMNIAHTKQINKKRISSVWDGWKLIEMDKFLDMPNKRLIKKKVSGIYNGKETMGKARAGILGWLLTDGCIFKRQNRKFEISISQSYSSNKEKCEIIKQLLLDSGLEHTIKLQKPNRTSYNPNGQMMIFRLSSKNNNLNWIFDYLIKIKTNKRKAGFYYLPSLKIFNLKQQELKILFDMMMLADGCRNSEFCKQDNKMIEFLQILCILIGKRCLLSHGEHNFTKKQKFRTWITDRDEVNILPSHINKIKYKGIVWCPSTKNNTWIAKRNGKVFITGNSLRHGFATQLVKNGVPIHHIRTLMGHSNISTTNVYLEANPQQALKSYEEKF